MIVLFKKRMNEDSFVDITQIDSNEISGIIFEFISCYMSEFILNMKNPTFHMDLYESILEHLQEIYDNIYNEKLEEQLRIIIQKECSTYFSTVLPRRSYKKTFSKNRINKKKITETIEFLRSVPQSEQRTTEWYQDRWNMISASSAWKALSSQSYKNSLIYEKCQPLDTNKYKSVNVDSPFHWGQKYEPLSIQIYENKYNTVVEDFGCIPHKKFKNIGASPDGINTDASSTRYGRMVEVKNRFSESVPITGIPKEEYWIQMQLQMNVCKLNECDFLETRFKEYSSYSQFKEDGNFNYTKHGKIKGIYLYFQKDEMPHYEYPELYLTEHEFEEWQTNKIIELEKKNMVWISNIYWYLDKYSCVLVFKNSLWFNEAVKEINSLWDIIIKERVSGYEHRAPTKRIRKNTEPTKKNCLINISGLKVI